MFCAAYALQNAPRCGSRGYPKCPQHKVLTIAFNRVRMFSPHLPIREPLKTAGNTIGDLNILQRPRQQDRWRDRAWPAIVPRHRWRMTADWWTSPDKYHPRSMVMRSGWSTSSRRAPSLVIYLSKYSIKLYSIRLHLSDSHFHTPRNQKWRFHVNRPAGCLFPRREQLKHC